MKVLILVLIGFNNKQVHHRCVFFTHKVKVNRDLVFLCKRHDEMKLVVCAIIDRDRNALLLVEQTPGRGYWFPFDDVKPDGSRALAAKRIANKVCMNFLPS